MTPGARYGKLTLIERVPRSRKSWFQCDCGKRKLTWTGKVKCGHIKSCGCGPRGAAVAPRFGPRPKVKPIPVQQCLPEIDEPQVQGKPNCPHGRRWPYNTCRKCMPDGVHVLKLVREKPEGYELAEIGKMLGVSKSRIDQILQQALAKLQGKEWE
jgi:hypothetical protein